MASYPQRRQRACHCECTTALGPRVHKETDKADKSSIVMYHGDVQTVKTVVSMVPSCPVASVVPTIGDAFIGGQMDPV